MDPADSRVELVFGDPEAGIDAVADVRRAGRAQAGILVETRVMLQGRHDDVTAHRLAIDDRPARLADLLEKELLYALQ